MPQYTSAGKGSRLKPFIIQLAEQLFCRKEGPQNGLGAKALKSSIWQAKPKKKKMPILHGKKN